MSHVFEALRKSEVNVEDMDLQSPEAFFHIIENAPQLTSIPSVNAEITPESRLAVWDNPHSLAADRYRLLRIHLDKLQGSGKFRSLLLTSASAQDGKTTVTLNLAIALAIQGKNKILVIEADLRRPSMIRRLGLKPWGGLTDCLALGLEPFSAVRRIDPLGFYLLPAGHPAVNPTELLQSDRLTQIVQLFSGCFDWILIDSPPARPIADTLALKPRVDACLVVARACKTPREGVEAVIRQFGPEFVVGIVLNGVGSIERECAEYYRKYYSPSKARNPATDAKA
ncbi:MAG: CpsD/CapB family tyrosine-protein kinase [Acidobacteriota bacterium]|nr:CpsD/CapB family tyrosine-protein kinase [Acidobacteriota bacterium]